MTGHTLLALLGASGVAAGFLAGLFGVGGGLVMVPVLLYAFDAAAVPPQYVVALALGTSMAAIVVSALQSAYAHYRRGSACAVEFKRAAPWVMIGVLCGSAFACGTSSRSLLLFVGAFQLVAAALMVADVSKLTAVQKIARQGAARNVLSVAFGGIAALAGIGGSTLFTPYFKATGMEPKRAVGTSAALGLPISLAGAIGYAWAGRNAHIGDWAVGFVSLPALLALVAGAALTVRAGVVIAHRIPPRALSASFGLFLCANGGHLLLQAAS
ncbi:MAG: sulfite exporter TauE/SafE family protein [Burkholderiaceae bacterium]|nr:sulfite exporter TauE/SafE family protein [Burkholderiaceae bacterium]